MSFIENEFAVFSTKELMIFDEQQFIEFVKRDINSEDEFNISTAVELSLLSKHQQNKFFEKLK